MGEESTKKDHRITRNNFKHPLVSRNIIGTLYDMLFIGFFSFRANWFIGIDSYTPHFKGNKHDIISIALEPLGSYEWIPILP